MQTGWRLTYREIPQMGPESRTVSGDEAGSGHGTLSDLQGSSIILRHRRQQGIQHRG
jgi:hypothetical protein